MQLAWLCCCIAGLGLAVTGAANRMTGLCCFVDFKTPLPPHIHLRVLLLYIYFTCTHLHISFSLTGFVHSAFTFAYESMIGRSNVSKANVPPGALVSFLQKGLQYIAIEETLRLDGSDRKSASGNVNDNGTDNSNQNGSNQEEITPLGHCYGGPFPLVFWHAPVGSLSTSRILD